MDNTAYLATLRKDIEFVALLNGASFRFSTTWGLFSPREIDAGTHQLLPYLEIKPNDACLDLGCGYGPIGLYMGARAAQGRSLMVDKDFVAIDYCRKNIQINQLDHAEAMLSNGFDQIPADRRFDVIASNIPAKVGKELLTLWLHDAYQRLNPGGRFYVVTINGLRQFMKRNISAVFDEYEKVKQGAHYTVGMGKKQ